MKQNIKLLVLLVAVALTGCNNKPITEQQGFEYGSVKNGRYTNKFFDIQVEVPAGWDVQSQAQNDALMEEGKDLVAGDDKMMKAAIKASEINTAGLLTVFKEKQGTNTTAFNPSFMLVAENLKNAPGVRSGKDYLGHSRKLMMAGQVKYSHLDETFEKRTINGWEFYTMNATVDIPGAIVKQVYLATVKDGFALGFIYTYGDEAQRAELEKVINTIDYYKKK
jgi:hypothetical protein